MSKIPTKVREAVKFRDFGRCCRCSSGSANEIHHRMRRREAGHTLSTCILLCGECHRWAHANPSKARETGYIVPTWGDTLSTPLHTWRGPLLLDDEGKIAFVTTTNQGSNT